MSTYKNNCLQIIKCPVCGEYLANIDENCGLYHYYCEDCHLVIRIEDYSLTNRQTYDTISPRGENNA